VPRMSKTQQIKQRQVLRIKNKFNSMLYLLNTLRCGLETPGSWQPPPVFLPSEPHTTSLTSWSLLCMAFPGWQCILVVLWFRGLGGFCPFTSTKHCPSRNFLQWSCLCAVLSLGLKFLWGILWNLSRNRYDSIALLFCKLSELVTCGCWIGLQLVSSKVTA
jgi:hypothetical protein